MMTIALVGIDLGKTHLSHPRPRRDRQGGIAPADEPDAARSVAGAVATVHRGD